MSATLPHILAAGWIALVFATGVAIGAYAGYRRGKARDAQMIVGRVIDQFGDLARLAAGRDEAGA